MKSLVNLYKISLYLLFYVCFVLFFLWRDETVPYPFLCVWMGAALNRSDISFISAGQGLMSSTVSLYHINADMDPGLSEWSTRLTSVQHKLHPQQLLYKCRWQMSRVTYPKTRSQCLMRRSCSTLDVHHLLISFRLLETTDDILFSWIRS